MSQDRRLGWDQGFSIYPAGSQIHPRGSGDVSRRFRWPSGVIKCKPHRQPHQLFEYDLLQEVKIVIGYSLLAHGKENFGDPNFCTFVCSRCREISAHQRWKQNTLNKSLLSA